MFASLYSGLCTYCRSMPSKRREQSRKKQGATHGQARQQQQQQHSQQQQQQLYSNPHAQQRRPAPYVDGETFMNGETLMHMMMSGLVDSDASYGEAMAMAQGMGEFFHPAMLGYDPYGGDMDDDDPYSNPFGYDPYGDEGEFIEEIEEREQEWKAAMDEMCQPGTGTITEISYRPTCDDCSSDEVWREDADDGEGEEGDQQFVKASTAKPQQKCNKCGKVLDDPLRCSRCKTTLYCGAECQREDWKAHKPNCCAPPPKPPPPPPVPIDDTPVTKPRPRFDPSKFTPVMCCSLPEWTWGGFAGSRPFAHDMNAQGLELRVEPARNVFSSLRQALQQSHQLPRVAVYFGGEHGSAPLSAADIVKEYVARGGIFIYIADIDNEFFERFDARLLWKNSNWYRSEATLTGMGSQILRGAPARYSAKSVWLEGVPSRNALYVTDDESRHQSMSMVLNGHTEVAERLCGIAMDDRRPQGEGVFAYIGDINLEAGTRVILASLVKYAM